MGVVRYPYFFKVSYRNLKNPVTILWILWPKRNEGLECGWMWSVVLFGMKPVSYNGEGRWGDPVMSKLMQKWNGETWTSPLPPATIKQMRKSVNANFPRRAVSGPVGTAGTEKKRMVASFPPQLLYWSSAPCPTARIWLSHRGFPPCCMRNISPRPAVVLTKPGSHLPTRNTHDAPRRD